jgi:hypothetical protein
MTAHPALDAYLAANPAQAVRGYWFLFRQHTKIQTAIAGHMVVRRDKAEAALEAVCGELAEAIERIKLNVQYQEVLEAELKRVIEQAAADMGSYENGLAAKDAEIKRLQAGIYEGALGDMPPTCPHANSIYSYCLACVIEERDAEIERLKAAIHTIFDYAVGREESIKGRQRFGMAMTYAKAVLDGHDDPMQAVLADWSDGSGLVTHFTPANRQPEDGKA